MIYMVELGLPDMATATAFFAWYEGHVRNLVGVPGLRTAQRLQAADGAPDFVQIYSVDGPEVFASAPYKAVGGPVHREVAEWSKQFTHWRRNLFVAADGADVRAPGFALGEAVRLRDADMAGGEGLWLRCVGLDGTTAFRAIGGAEGRGLRVVTGVITAATSGVA